MSDLGNFASRFNISSELLKEFDEALLFIKGQEEIVKTPEVSERINVLLKVITPVRDGINDKLSESIEISELTIIDFIRDRHTNDWTAYTKNIDKLNYKLNSKKFQLTQDDFQILNDIADALDSECADLFHKMSEK